MERRHQVFISSTYQDLAEERAEVIQALLELDMIPAGMELFPAASEDQWSLIKRVIDACDYYIVVSAGRYGSVDGAGVSYTEKEYRYALEVGIPTLAFLHKSPSSLPVSRSESTDASRGKLDEFRKLLEQKHCKYWQTPQELGSVVSRGLVQLTRTNPRPGWVRADRAAESIAADEILSLRRKIEALKERLEQQRNAPPPEAANLEQGDDEFEFSAKVSFTSKSDRQDWTVDIEACIAWDEIFMLVGPSLIGELAEHAFQTKTKKMLEERARVFFDKASIENVGSVYRLTLLSEPFDQVKIQLRALGLVTKSDRNRGVNDRNTYWTLTPYGDTYLMQLLARTRM
jgi:hypothetical protein